MTRMTTWAQNMEKAVSDLSMRNDVLGRRLYLLQHAIETTIEDPVTRPEVRRHLQRAIASSEALAAGRAEDDTRPVEGDDGNIKCQFCDCLTNAKLRACCEKGREQDLRISEFAKKVSLIKEGDEAPSEQPLRDGLVDALGAVAQNNLDVRLGDLADAVINYLSDRGPIAYKNEEPTKERLREIHYSAGKDAVGREERTTLAFEDAGNLALYNAGRKDESTRWYEHNASVMATSEQTLNKYAALHEVAANDRKALNEVRSTLRHAVSLMSEPTTTVELAEFVVKEMKRAQEGEKEATYKLYALATKILGPDATQGDPTYTLEDMLGALDRPMHEFELTPQEFELAPKVIEFLRQNFRNNGAEGESVWKACELLEKSLGIKQGCVPTLNDIATGLREAVQVDPLRPSIQNWVEGVKYIVRLLQHVRLPQAASADDLRKKGWMVVCHNDYKQHALLNTFWSFSKANERGRSIYVSGEGLSDTDALNEVRAKVEQIEKEEA